MVQTTYDDFSSDHQLLTKEIDRLVETTTSILPDEDNILRSFIDRYTTLLVRDSVYTETEKEDAIAAAQAALDPRHLHGNTLQRREPSGNDNYFDGAYDSHYEDAHRKVPGHSPRFFLETSAETMSHEQAVLKEARKQLAMHLKDPEAHQKASSALHSPTEPHDHPAVFLEAEAATNAWFEKNSDDEGEDVDSDDDYEWVYYDVQVCQKCESDDEDGLTKNGIPQCNRAE